MGFFMCSALVEQLPESAFGPRAPGVQLLAGAGLWPIGCCHPLLQTLLHLGHNPLTYLIYLTYVNISDR